LIGIADRSGGGAAMEKEYTKAKIFLEELKKEENLRSIIKTPSSYRSYAFDTIYFSIAIMAVFFIADRYKILLQSSRWVVGIAATAVVFALIWISIKVIRQEERFNALVQLLDIENTPYKCAENENRRAEKQ
jgi:amino acid permease